MPVLHFYTFELNTTKRRKDLDRLVNETLDMPVLQASTGQVSLCVRGDKPSCSPAAIGTTLACGQFLRTGGDSVALLRFKASGADIRVNANMDFMLDCSEKRGRAVPSCHAVTSARL